MKTVFLNDLIPQWHFLSKGLLLRVIQTGVCITWNGSQNLGHFVIFHSQMSEAGETSCRVSAPEQLCFVEGSLISSCFVEWVYDFFQPNLRFNTETTLRLHPRGPSHPLGRYGRYDAHSPAGNGGTGNEMTTDFPKSSPLHLWVLEINSVLTSSWEVWVLEIFCAGHDSFCTLQHVWKNYMLHLVKVHHWLLHVGWSIIVDDVLHLDSTWPLWFSMTQRLSVKHLSFQHFWCPSHVEQHLWQPKPGNHRSWNNSIKKTALKIKFITHAFCLILSLGGGDFKIYSIDCSFLLDSMDYIIRRSPRLGFAVLESIEGIVSRVLVHISLEKKKRLGKSFRNHFRGGLWKKTRQSL